MYDEAKRFAESLTTAYRARHAANTGIARIFNCYGPRMRPNDGRAIPRFIRQALRGSPLTVAGDGSQTRSVCHVDDLVDGLTCLIKSDLAGPINLGNPDEISVLELAKRVRTAVASPAIFMDTASAEMVKYASNCFLATRLSYVNEIAELCEQLDADIASATKGMGYDPRIGESYLRPGPGWGGSCLPKDAAAVLHAAKQLGLELPLLQASVLSNEQQRGRVVQRVRLAAGGALDGKRIGLLGLAFKAGTNDLRDSPALGVAEQLAVEGAELTAYDPAVPKDVPGVTGGITVVSDAFQAVMGADVVVVLTEWPAFRALDWARVAGLMAGRTVVDTRNLLDTDELRAVGIALRGIGIRMP